MIFEAASNVAGIKDTETREFLMGDFGMLGGC